MGTTEDIQVSYRSRLFEKIGHETTFASSGNKHHFTKAASKQEGPNNLGYPTKKQSFFLYKRTAFLSGASNIFGPFYFEVAFLGK